MDDPRKILAPYKIGSLVDMIGFTGGTDVFPLAVQFALDEAYRKGLIDRPCEVLAREVAGVPYGDGLATRAAYRALAAEGVLCIAGPMTSDNTIAILGVVEELRVPNIVISGTQTYGGPHSFVLGNGSLPDDPAYLASWLKQQGHRTVGIIRDYPSRIGIEYLRFFDFAAQINGLEPVLVANVPPHPELEHVVDAMQRLKAAQPDALVYLGYGEVCRFLNTALEAVDWWPPRIMTTAFVSATYNEYRARDIDGWYGVDQYDERNDRLRSMLARYEVVTGRTLVPNSVTSLGFDIGNCFALALSRMETATPEAIASALETIRMLPACTGGPGSYISFGPWDHRGLKGLDFLNIRRSEGGTTHLVEFTLG